MRIITDTLTARHEREARQHERRQRLPAVQRVHLLRCRSGAPSLPAACEDVSWMGAQCNTFGMAFTLGAKWKHQGVDAAHTASGSSVAEQGDCKRDLQR